MKVLSKDRHTLDHQTQRLTEIGLQLKLRREEQHISLREIQRVTLISERHLRAIESGNISSLPEPVYIQSFIRKYALALGIEDFAEEFPLSKPPSSKSWFKSPLRSPFKSLELRPLHLYLIYIAVISASVGALSNGFNQVYYPISESETKLSPSARLQPRQAKSLPQNSSLDKSSQNKSSQNKIGQNKLAQNKLAQAQQNKPVTVGIMMKGESWMRVEVDGEVKFEGVLTEGSNKTWAANSNIVLRAGNAAAVLLEFNQNPPQALGRAGEVVQKTYTSKLPGKLG